MYSINFVSSSHWEISGELTKAEYYALMRYIRIEKLVNLYVSLPGGRVITKTTQGITSCNPAKAITGYIHSCVALAKLAVTPEVKTQQLEDAKRWVMQKGYGYRYRI